MEKNPIAFMTLVAKCMPTKIEGNIAVEVGVSAEARRAIAQELLQRAFLIAPPKVIEAEALPAPTVPVRERASPDD